MLPFFTALGLLFGSLAGACAYLISYHEYRQRMLRPDQSPKRMAAGTAAGTFGFFVVACVLLAFVLSP
jgi:uncharacterized protein (DUF2062 family)